ncbi:hypothetical protein BHE74_00005517 [Ensete ventricosum]|nr:hypothetical protein BHE74_00005517 [Ensete ventricosum]
MSSTPSRCCSGSVESSSLEKHESCHSTCVVQELSQLLESYCYRRKPKCHRGRESVCRRYRAKSGEEKSNGVGYDLPELRAQSAKMSSAEEGISTNRVEVATDLRKQRPKEVATNLREQLKMRKKKPPLQAKGGGGGGGECQWRGRSKQSAGGVAEANRAAAGWRSPCVSTLGAWFSALIQGQKKQLHLTMVTDEERMPQPHARRPCRIYVGVLQECDRPDDWSIKGSVAGSISERVAEATTARGRSSRRLVGSEVVAHVGKESYLVWKQRAEMRQGKTLTEEAMVQPTRCSRAMVES